MDGFWSNFSLTKFLALWGALLSTSSILIAATALRLALRKEKRDAARVALKVEILTAGNGDENGAPDLPRGTDDEGGDVEQCRLLVAITNHGRGSLQIRKLLMNSRTVHAGGLPRRLQEGEDFELILDEVHRIPSLKTLCVEDATAKRWWLKHKEIRALQKACRKMGLGGEA